MQVRVTTRNRITVPKPLRDLIGLVPGSAVDFAEKRNGDIRIIPRDPEIRKRLRALGKVLRDLQHP
jgi:AbrB family looped-hinge helix DNA binding protein